MVTCTIGFGSYFYDEHCSAYIYSEKSNANPIQKAFGYRKARPKNVEH